MTVGPDTLQAAGEGAKAIAAICGAIVGGFALLSGTIAFLFRDKLRWFSRSAFTADSECERAGDAVILAAFGRDGNRENVSALVLSALLHNAPAARAAIAGLFPDEMARNAAASDRAKANAETLTFVRESLQSIREEIGDAVKVGSAVEHLTLSVDAMTATVRELGKIVTQNDRQVALSSQRVDDMHERMKAWDGVNTRVTPERPMAGGHRNYDPDQR